MGSGFTDAQLGQLTKILGHKGFKEITHAPFRRRSRALWIRPTVVAAPFSMSRLFVVTSQQVLTASHFRLAAVCYR
jgi:hypothetical protein